MENFTGNLLTQEEKDYRLRELYELNIKVWKDLDMEFLPYLERINDSPFICTTQCCVGNHKPDDDGAHFDFRCSKPPEWVIDNLLKPLVEKFSGIHISLYGLHCDMLRYCIWIHPKEYGYQWWEPVEYFISLLEDM
uniref:Uncharacterized protein n=1 Tax=viral metagenome TaxID=1070528 RepID=A0A6M3MIE9_9ZZZZ